jgi:HNH endonuclease
MSHIRILHPSLKGMRMTRHQREHGSISVEALIFTDFGRNPRIPSRGVGGPWRAKLRKRPCFYCNASLSGSIDHVLPRAQYGLDRPENCLPACRSCNEEKGSRTPSQWFAYLWHRKDPRAIPVATLLTNPQIEQALLDAQDNPQDWQRYQCWPNLP